MIEIKIYVGHSSSIDYEKELYQPLKQSKLNEEHELVFPHEGSDELFDSKSFLRDECDLFVAEVSEASTGLGIELGWAAQFDVPIICVHREGSDPSGSLKAVTEEVKLCESPEKSVEYLKKEIKKRSKVQRH